MLIEALHFLTRPYKRGGYTETDTEREREREGEGEGEGEREESGLLLRSHSSGERGLYGVTLRHALHFPSNRNTAGLG